MPLDRPLERPGAELGAESLLDQEVDRALVPFDRPRLHPEPAALEHVVELLLEQAAHHFAAERAEDHDAVEAVEELGPEGAVDGLEHGRGVEFPRRADEADAGPGRDRRAEVGGEDDHAMAQIDCAPVAVGQPAVVEDLEEDVPDLRVRLLELVEQEDGEGLLADLGDQRRGLLLRCVRVPEEAVEALRRLVLAHVKPDEAVLGAEHKGAEGLRDLRLAGTGGTDEEEDTERARRVGEPRLDECDPIDEAVDRLGLTEHASLEVPTNPVEAQGALGSSTCSGSPVASLSVAITVSGSIAVATPRAIRSRTSSSTRSTFPGEAAAGR